MLAKVVSSIKKIIKIIAEISIRKCSECLSYLFFCAIKKVYGLSALSKVKTFLPSQQRQEQELEAQLAKRSKCFDNGYKNLQFQKKWYIKCSLEGIL